jgi:23S rRNA maturation mini-RNase III
MAYDCKALRRACRMPLYVRRTKYTPAHTVHKIGDTVRYIESENIEPVSISMYLCDAKTYIRKLNQFSGLQKRPLSLEE